MTTTDLTAPIEPLLVDGNVNVGKDKGSGLLLMTGQCVFALRTHASGTATGMAAGGLIGALIGAMIDKRRAKKRAPADHMQDPEIRMLDAKKRKKLEPCTLLMKAPIDETLVIKRTKMGYQFTLYGEEKPLIVYQGLLNKKKIAKHIEKLSRIEQAQ